MNDNDELRKRSNYIIGNDKLQAFLYDLLRDELTPGKVEELVRAAQGNQPNETFVYTNGWLALYAKDLADRLR